MLIVVVYVSQPQIAFIHVAVPEAAAEGQKEIIAKLDPLHRVDNIPLIPRFFHVAKIHVVRRSGHQAVGRVRRNGGRVTLVAIGEIPERVVSLARSAK